MPMPFPRPAVPGAALRRAGALALDSLLPPRCLSCGVQVDRQGALCPSCWTEVAFVEAPVCARCGLPFEVAVEPDAICGACARREPAFRLARAALRYDDGSRRLILALKHGDRTDAARPFARWMARAGRPLLAEAELIVPVPLHWTRLVRRRFNQAALLAHALAAESGATVAPDLLVRRRRTPSQGGLTARQRALNVRGAFAVQPKRRPRVEGRRVLLVDDVMTTGATIEACTRALHRAGAADVDALVLARVVRPSMID
jgi:ComF family protein